MARNSKGASDAPDTNTFAGTDLANPGTDAPGAGVTGAPDAAATNQPAPDGAEGAQIRDLARVAEAAGATDGAGQGDTADADAAAQGAMVHINTDAAAVAVLSQPAVGESDNVLVTVVGDAQEMAEEIIPAARQTLREAVAVAAADAAKAGEHATHGVLNAIEVKLAELRNTIVASEGQVADEFRHVLDWFENLL